MFWWLIGDWPYSKLWRKFKKRLINKSWILREKNNKNLIFIHKFLIIICYFHFFFSDSIISLCFGIETAEKNLENFSIFLNLQFSESTIFTFHVINWLKFNLEQNTKIPSKDPSKIVLLTYIWKLQFERYQQRYRGSQIDPLGCLLRWSKSVVSWYLDLNKFYSKENCHTYTYIYIYKVSYVINFGQRLEMILSIVYNWLSWLVYFSLFSCFPGSQRQCLHNLL